MRLTALFAAAALTVTHAASAADLLTATAAEPIAAIMQDAGLQADIGTDASGDPIIASSTAGAKFSVLFYGCSGGKDCTSVQLNACFDLTDGTTLEIANAWNKDMRYGKASLDENLDPCLLMDINMAAGIAPDTFRNSLDNWSQILGKFIAAIGYN